LTSSWHLQRVRSTLPLQAPKNPAQAEAEDVSKIKDRLEALLFAETLQGTLSPNANPRKGVRWRLTEFDAASTREDSADYSDTSSLVLDLIVIPNGMEFAQVENQKSYRAGVERTLLSAAFDVDIDFDFDI
jgi:hypothetical protein